MKPIVVVATLEEYELAKTRFTGCKIIKTGVGGVNIIESLKHIPRWRKIINFGYAGSHILPKGTEVSIGFCSHYHPRTEYMEPTYTVNNNESSMRCYTSDEFVESTEIEGPCVFDMELAYICALGFKKIESIKIISDCLDEQEYEETIKNGDD